MATPTQRMQLRYVHAQPPLGQTRLHYPARLRARVKMTNVL